MGNINPINHDGIKVDDIAEKTGSHGIEIANTVKVDQIDELTPANGVVVDSLTIKDGGVSGSGDLVTSGNVQCDTIIEKTATSGVTIDSTLLKDGGVTATGTIDTSGTLTTDTINEHTSTAGVTVDGALIKDLALKIDTITESTTNNGVVVETVEIENGSITLPNNTYLQADNSSGTPVDVLKLNSSNELEFNTALTTKKSTHTTTLSSTMTLGTVTKNFEEWLVIGDQVFGQLDCSFNPSGTGHPNIAITIPADIDNVGSTVGRVCGFGMASEDSAYRDCFVIVGANTDELIISPYDRSNWDSTSSNTRIRVSLQYTSV